MRKFILLSTLLVYLHPSFAKSEMEFVQLGVKGTGWKAGVAKVEITPNQPMWMAGYGSRNKPSEGTLHGLWAKALVMEDATGNQVVLVTADLLGIPKEISDEMRNQLKIKYGLSKSQIMLNSSHTHSGPVLENALSDIYPLDSEQSEKVRQYSRQLERQVVDLVGEAIAGIEPVELFAQNGVTRFQVNRRNNDASELTRLTELKGPNDYAVPVIKVMNRKGELKAVAFGYACHPTVLSGYEWSGDYAGFAQLELEKSYPGVIALFFQGAGADQNPLPRRTVPLAKQYGKELAAAVERVLNEDMQKLRPELNAAYSEIELPLNAAPSGKELSEMANNSTVDYYKRWADRMLVQLNEDKLFQTSYSYPVQVWKLGDQPVIALGGELVVEYAIELKKAFGQNIFVMGYTNDVMAYIPSHTILEEGGYEGDSSQKVYGLPSTWARNIQTLILEELEKLALQVGLSKVAEE